MPKRSMDVLTESMFYVLMAFLDGPKCGADIVEHLESITRGRIMLGPATLYTILGKFEKEKLICEVAVEGRKRTYDITHRGRQAYAQELERLKLCIQDAEAYGGGHHE